MKNESEKIRFLLDLMDDENEQTASLAMAELLRSDRQDLVNRRLCELQETRDPRMRRRVHQLQCAIGSRFCRAWLADDFRRRKLELLDGAIKLHLCWFDNDRYENVAAQWNELHEQFFDARPDSLSDFGAFMIHRGLNPVSSRDDIDPENYCIGSVIDDTPGSDLILSLIASQLTADSPIRLRMIRSGLDFGVADVHGNRLYPGQNWRVVPARKGEPVQILDDTQVLRMIASVLFFAAVASDGFRYLYTLGTALAAAIGCDSLDFLPFPYRIPKTE